MADYATYSDEMLVALLKQGDRPAYSEIYERYWALLLFHAEGMLRNEQLAQDLVQDVFIRLWEKAAELHIHGSLSAYLYGAVRFGVLNHFRHAKVAEAYLNQLQGFLDSGAAPADSRLLEKELAQKIEDALKHLPPKMRQVFELSRIRELSYREISEQLQLADNTVKRQISNALKILRTKLQSLLMFL